MKTCSYCGAEYADDVSACPLDHTSLDGPAVAAATEFPTAFSQPFESPDPRYQFTPLSPEDMTLDWVTLLRCENLGAADLIASRLGAAGIAVFIPDENLMQMIGFNLNTFGYVRVQVSPADYEAAKAVLTGEGA